MPSPAPLPATVLPLFSPEHMGPTVAIEEPAQSVVVRAVRPPRSRQMVLFVSRISQRADETRDDAARRRRLEAERAKRKRHRSLAAADGHAIVVIVVPPTRDEDTGPVPNVPDCLGRVLFESTGYGPPRKNFANLKAWLRHLKDLGRKWRLE